MLEDGENFDNPLVEKIVVIGLMNAGKTSLIKALFHDFDEIDMLGPTQSIERTHSEFFNQDITIWDFGGQEKYRAVYLENPELYFREVSNLIYVVDGQNSEDILVSINFFKEIFDISEKFCKDVEITLLFHKYDPDLFDMEQFERNRINFLDSVLPILNSRKRNYQVFNSSIYDPFSISTAISKAIIHNDNVYDAISQILTKFSLKHLLLGACVFNRPGFQIGGYYSPKADINRIRGIYLKFWEQFKTMYDLLPSIEIDFQGLHIYSQKISIKSALSSKAYHVYVGFMYDDAAAFNRFELQDVIKDLTAEIDKNKDHYFSSAS